MARKFPVLDGAEAIAGVDVTTTPDPSSVGGMTPEIVSPAGLGELPGEPTEWVDIEPLRQRPVRDDRSAFTLIEVLVVIAIIAILAALLLPALDKAKGRSKAVNCLSNLKQLAVAAQLYAADNGGLLPENHPGNSCTNCWTRGDMGTLDATNTALLRQGKLFSYAGREEVFRCPADAPARARSYAMNSWMGSREMEKQSAPTGYRTFVKDTECAAGGAAKLWYLADEHPRTLDDGWFLVTLDDSRPFASFPGLSHQQGCALNFADGHAEVWKLRDPATLAAPGADTQINSRNADWLKLKAATSIQ